MEETDLFGNPIVKDVLLRDKFLEPPFSILDTRQGSWQNRKRRWQNLGMKSEIGRADELTYTGAASKFDYYRVKEGKRETTDEQSTSIFDPALTELMYNWFCPEKGMILDPFAGGSVRGIVANYLGFNYTGIELRQEQVDSNREQAINLLPVNNQPQWYCGDSEKVLGETWQHQFDMIFSCPPYADLEVYSDLPDDLSNMDYKAFATKYRTIIGKALKLLKRDCYAVFVVGEVRGKDGFYYDFVGDTKRAFIEQGAKLYNDCVLLNVVGSASMRAGKVFDAGKKLTKIHQNVLVFKKI
jgi:DNA modification methylase